MAHPPGSIVFGRPWSHEEDRILTRMSEAGARDVEIASRLDRSAASVYRRRNRLGLTVDSGRANIMRTKAASEARRRRIEGPDAVVREITALVRVADIAAHYAGQRYDDCPRARRDGHNQMPKRTPDVGSIASSAMAW
jgi:hypothetical protein